MSLSVGDAKFNIKNLLHGTKEAAILDIEMMMERAANTLLLKIDPLDTMRLAALSSTIHDDVYNYALPSDFKKPLDLYPQDDRDVTDQSRRWGLEEFDLTKAISDRTVSIEADGGTKFLRVNWRSRQGVVLHNMNDVDDNGTWVAVGTATGIQANTIFKVSGNASIEFDIVTTGDGIANSGMTAIDMTDEDEVADIFVWMYFGSVANLTSISARWGNDLTANYWSSVAQTTQADGTAFKVGWNLIKFPWSTATETGTVDPTLIDSFRVTCATSGTIANVRVDNIVFSIGRNFDLKYYSKYIFKNTSGTWLSRPTSDNDTIVLDNDAIQLYLLECLIASAQQMQNKQMANDIGWARQELAVLLDKYREEHPSQTRKMHNNYYRTPTRNSSR